MLLNPSQLLHYRNGRSYNRAMGSDLRTQPDRNMPALSEEGGGIGPNAAVVYLSARSQGTRRTAKESLQVIAGIIAPGLEWDRAPWHLLRAEHVAAIRAELATRYAPGTVNKCMYYLRGVLKTAWRLEQLGAEDLARALDFQPIKGSRLPAGRDIPEAEIAAIFATCDGSTVGIRDRAILSVLRHGLRRSEVEGLDLADFDQAAATLTIRNGKGGYQRLIPLHVDAAAALARWIELRGDHAGALFTSTAGDGKGRQAGSRLSGQVIYELVDRRRKWAGIERVITPHDWRRTAAGDLFDSGVDVATIAAILGHRSIAVTGQYDRRPVEARRAAVGRLYMPTAAERLGNT